MDDFISRQAAIGTLDDEITITGKSNAYVVKDYVQRVKRKLENLPSAEPERKKGEWVKTESMQYFRKHYPTYTCSICGFRKGGKWNYCPNCGARMTDETD